MSAQKKTVAAAVGIAANAAACLLVRRLSFADLGVALLIMGYLIPALDMALSAMAGTRLRTLWWVPPGIAAGVWLASPISRNTLALMLLTSGFYAALGTVVMLIVHFVKAGLKPGTGKETERQKARKG